MNKQNSDINLLLNYYIIAKSNSNIDKTNSMKIRTKNDRNKVFCNIIDDKNKASEFAKNIENMKIEALIKIFDENITHNPLIRSLDSLTALYLLIKNENIKKTLLHAMLQNNSKALIYIYNRNAIEESNCISELIALNDNYSNIYFTAVFNKRCGEINIDTSLIDIIYEIEHRIKDSICHIIYNHVENKEGFIDVFEDAMKNNINAKSIALNNYSFIRDKIANTHEIEDVIDNYNSIKTSLEIDDFQSAKTIIDELDIKSMTLIINSIYTDKGLNIAFNKIKSSDINNYENELAKTLSNIIKFSSNNDIILNSIELISTVINKLNDTTKNEICKIINVDFENIELTTGKILIDLVKSLTTATNEYKLISNFDKLQDISKYNYRLLIVAAMIYKTGTYRILLEYVDNDEQREMLDAECKYLLDRKLIPSTVKDLDNDRFKEIIIKYFNNNDYDKVLINKQKKNALNAAFIDWCKNLNVAQLENFISNGLDIIDCLNDESLEILKYKINENITEIKINDEIFKLFLKSKLDIVNFYNQLSEADREKALQYYKINSIENYNRLNNIMINRSNKESLIKYLKEYDFENALKYREEEYYSSIVGEWIKSLSIDDIKEIIINNISFIEKQSIGNVNNLLNMVYVHYENKSIDDEKFFTNLLLIGADSLKLYEILHKKGKSKILRYLFNHRPGIAEKIYREKIVDAENIYELDNLIDDFNNISNGNIIIVLKMKAYGFIEESIINLSSLDKNYITESKLIAESLCKYGLEKRFYYDNLLLESADKKVLDSIKKEILKISIDFNIIESYIDSLDVLLMNENFQDFKEEFNNIIDVIMSNDNNIELFMDKLIRKDYKKEILYMILNKFGRSIIDKNNLERQLKSELNNIEYKNREIIADYVKKSISGLEKAISRAVIDELSKESLSKYIKQLRVSLNSIGIETVEDVDLYLKKVKFDPELHQNNNLKEGILETLGFKVNNSIIEYCLLKEED